MVDHGVFSGAHVPTQHPPRELLLSPGSWWARTWRRLTPARDLDAYTLTGSRGPGPIRVVVAHDVSGSMTAFAAPRQQALAYFFAWVPLNLRPYDEVAVLDFAGTAAWTLRPTSVDEIAQGRHTLIDPGVVDQTSTNLRPVLERVAALPFTPARTSVWLFSDGQYGDYPDHETDARHVLAEAGVTTLPLLVPDPTITVPTRWSDCFSREVLETFHGLDPHETALALGHATAATTRQHLTRTS